MPRSRLTALTTLTLGAVLVLSACSQGGTGATTPPASPSPTTAASPSPEPSKEPPKPIIVGASVSLTGNYARTGQNMLNGYQLAIEHINAAGGVLGRPLELKVYDDQSEPETSGKLYEKLITEDKTDVIIGPYSSPVSLVASTVAEKHQIPIIIAGASSSEIWGRGYKYTFGMYTLAPTYSHGALEIAKEKGLTTVAIVNEATAFAQDVARGAEEKAKELGLTVVFHEEYKKGTTDFTALLTKIRALNPDVFIGGTYLPESVELTRQSRDLGFAPKIFFFTVGPALPDFGKNLEKDAEFIIGDSQWERVMKAEGIADFVKAYKDKYGEEPGYHAAGGYAGVQVLAKAIETAGSTDPAKVRDALATLEVSTVFGPWKADETGANIGKPHFLIQWQNGKREVVWPYDYASSPLVYPFPAWNQR